MNNITSLSEHSDAILILFTSAVLVIAWFLRRDYRILTGKLDRMETCLLEVKKYYAKKEDLDMCQAACKTNRADCKGYGRECTDRILRVLERVEKNVDRNHSLIFYLADALVTKGTMTGEDLTKLRDKMETGK